VADAVIEVDFPILVSRSCPRVPFGYFILPIVLWGAAPLYADWNFEEPSSDLLGLST
jgi:hypothetical protein